MRRLFQHAIGGLAIRLTPDHATGHLFALRSDLRQCKCCGIRHREVAGLMHDIDGDIGTHRVQILPGGMCQFCQLGIVIAKTHNGPEALHLFRS